LNLETKRVVVEAGRCKGCEICLAVCPRNALAMSQKLNPKGYFVVELRAGDDCTSCGLCALMCPDVALRVYTP
jgi:2-oxoglutarate ferredoxin oxidoreductase subunit delta